MSGARSRVAGKGLTGERICAAALAIIDYEGLPALNMRRLGANVVRCSKGVSGPGLR